MPQKAKTEADSMEENENIVELTAEDGSVIKLEFLDLIEYCGGEYAVFIETEADSDEVIILLAENLGAEDEQFSRVEDENVVSAVFELFRERNSDIFDFE